MSDLKDCYQLCNSRYSPMQPERLFCKKGCDSDQETIQACRVETCNKICIKQEQGQQKLFFSTNIPQIQNFYTEHLLILDPASVHAFLDAIEKINKNDNKIIPNFDKLYNSYQISKQKYSMKRNSLPANTQQTIPRAKKRNTEIFQQPIPINGHCFKIKRCLPEIISQEMISQILGIMQKSIDGILESQFYELIIDDIVRDSGNISMAKQPQQVCYIVNDIQVYDRPAAIDEQPIRICFDPLCGFDKLVTRKNQLCYDKSHINKLLPVKTHKSSVTTIIVNELSKNKQQSFTSNSNNNHMIPKIMKKKAYNMISQFKVVVEPNNNNVMRQKFQNILVPLELEENEKLGQKQSEKHQKYFRQRLFENIPNLPLLMQECLKPSTDQQNNKQLGKTKNSIKGNIVSVHGNEDRVFDYNGDKIALNYNRLSTNMTNRRDKSQNVLRTSYHISQYNNISNLESHIQNYLVKKTISNKNRDSKLLANKIFDEIKKQNSKTIQSEDRNSCRNSGFLMNINPIWALSNNQPPLSTILQDKFKEIKINAREKDQTDLQNKKLGPKLSKSKLPSIGKKENIIKNI